MAKLVALYNPPTAVADLANFASGGATILIFEHSRSDTVNTWRLGSPSRGA